MLAPIFLDGTLYIKKTKKLGKYIVGAKFEHLQFDTFPSAMATSTGDVEVGSFLFL